MTGLKRRERANGRPSARVIRRLRAERRRPEPSCIAGNDIALSFSKREAPDPVASLRPRLGQIRSFASCTGDLQIGRFPPGVLGHPAPDVGATVGLG